MTQSSCISTRYTLNLVCFFRRKCWQNDLAQGPRNETHCHSSDTAKASESNSPEKKLENPTSSLLQAFVRSCPRCAELAVAELGLQAARPQTRPGGAKPKALLNHEQLEPDAQKACQRVSARLACLASDRPDCKECNRAVGKATPADLTRFNRIARYLLHAPRALWELPVQNEEGTVTVEGLSVGDAAGCPKTPRSTSEGSLRIGPDTLATWSSTQKWWL